ncbi:MAG: hypothetical protein AB3N24_23755 [Leisingera sp.]
MQRFTSWSEIEPTEAERKLMQAAVAGEFCDCGPEGQTPPEPADWSSLPADRHIRADVLRFLLRGGCDSSQVTEVGVMLEGALISGELDLTDCEIRNNMLLHNCRFQKGIHANRCNALKNFRLRSCKLPLLNAAGLKVGGQLNCDGTEFQNQNGTALNLQDADIGRTLSLDSVKILGAADLNGLKTGGQLDCEGAEFQNKDGMALNLQNAVIGQGFLFRDQVTVQGAVNLNAAYCGSLADDPECWPDSGHLILDGFTYHRLHGATDARTRLNWLARGDRWKGEFFPQPYKQLAKVLHDMGHEADAREVLYVLEKKLGAERRRQLRQEIADLRNITPSLGLRTAKYILLATDYASDWLQRVTVGYGRKPFRSLGVLAGLITAFWFATLAAWHAGGFAPNSSIVLTSPEWASYDSRGKTPKPAHPAGHWSNQTIPRRDCESFSPLAYAADVVVPIIDFGQTDAWAPSTTRGPAGVFLWWARWLFTLAGWIVTALGAAALTGIIRRE